MNKFTKFLFSLIVVAFVPFAFIGCGDNADGNKVAEIVLVDGEQEGSVINYEFDYGEALEFSDLKAYVKLRNGTKREMTEEEYGELEFSYNLPDGTEVHEFPSMYEKLDAGTYYITVKYGQYSVNVSVTINPINAEISNFVSQIKDKNGQNLANKTIEFGTGTIDENKYTSNYTVLFSRGGKYLNKSELVGIYVLTENEYLNEYSALTTREEKMEYLNLHTFIPQEEDGVVINNQSRCITYNNDSKSDTEFYVMFDDFGLKPGNYYMFAQSSGGENFNSYFTEPNPNTKIVVKKQVVSIKNNLVPSEGPIDWEGENENEGLSSLELWNKLNLHADFDYNSTYFNETDQGWYPKIGNITLGFLQENYGIKHNDSANFLNHLSLKLGSSEVGLFGVGDFEFCRPDTEINSTNNGSSQQVKFVFSEGLSDYYETTETYFIPLTVTKGVVSEPYSYSEVPEVTYEYGNVGPGYCNVDKKYMNAVGTEMATIVGNYSVRFELIDSVNYVWSTEQHIDGCYYGNVNREFSWKIVKRAVALPEVTITYAENAISDWEVVDDGDHNEISITLDYASLFDASYFEGREFVWSIGDGTDGTITCSLDSNANSTTNTLTFSNITASTNYIQIFVSAPADTNFEAFNQEIAFIISQE